jgi:hypothetical protein
MGFISLASIAVNRPRSHAQIFFGPSYSKGKNMPEPDELTLPSPPRGKRAEIKAEWTRMAKSMADQGIDPNSRIYLLWDCINTVCEDGDLSLAREDACLRDKIALSRRFSELLNQKLKLRKMLLAPEIKSQAKAMADQGK